ncbi:MAG: polysaccharide deacetylase family protein [Candidatus Omnitrophica bacterium]|nr:polysaccharide deacetylase family protein [Candidatus Omnitrophota bacterium]
MPRFLKLFDECNLKATFFVVANDFVGSNQNREILRDIISRGHEVANHSLNHEFAFSSLSRHDKEADIINSTDIIKDACGVLPRGFRIPGYDIDEVTIDILDKNGYLYDSSLYKFPLYPFLRRLAYMKIKGVLKNPIFNNLTEETYRILQSPIMPYHPVYGKFWRVGKTERKILEMPVSVIPLLCLPFNSTFLFLSGRPLFELGLWMTEKMGIDLNYNFHSTDMLSSINDDVHVKHPGIGLDYKKKFFIFKNMISRIRRAYNFITLEELAKKSYHECGKAHGSNK